MSEDIFVFHCAPTLAGIKTGSLFTCPYKEKSQVVTELRALNRRLGPKGLRVIPLRYLPGKVLVYVYRPRGLERDLGDSQARSILAEAGYESADAGRSVAELMRRFARNGDFPHEIGLFLSYPPEDVRGYMLHRGRDCKCVGAWAVYGDEEKARRLFEQYRRCTSELCRKHRVGRMSLEQLAVAG